MNKYWLLIVAAFLPFLVIFAVFVYTNFIITIATEKPKYDYVYYLPSRDASSNLSYQVREGRLKVMKFEVMYQDTSEDVYSKPILSDQKNTAISEEEFNNLDIYYHDVSENKSRKLTFRESQQLNLDSSFASPDGFVFGMQNSPVASSDTFALTKEYSPIIFQKVTIDNSDKNSPRSPIFLGWVLSS